MLRVDVILGTTLLFGVLSYGLFILSLGFRDWNIGYSFVLTGEYIIITVRFSHLFSFFAI